MYRLVALAFLLVCPGFVAAQDAPKTVAVTPSVLDALPDTTTLVVRFRNCADFVRKFEQSPFYGLKDSPSVKQFIDALKIKFNEGMAEARQDLGFDPLEFINQIEGEVVLAVGGLDKVLGGILAEINGAQSNTSPGDIPILFSINAGSSSAKAEEYLQKVFGFIEKEGGKKEQMDFQGGTIWSFAEPKKADPKGPPSSGELEKVYFAKKGTTFFFSIHREFLQSTMSAVGGDPGSALTRQNDFVITHRQVETDSDLLIFLNIQAVTKAVRGLLQNSMFGMVWTMIENELIGKNLKNLGLSMSLRKDAIYSLSFVNTGGEREGLLALLDGPMFSSRKPVDGIPPDSEAFYAFTLNIPRLYNLVLKVANMAMTFMGGGGPGMDLEVLLEQQLGMKVRDVIEAFGSKVYYYNSPVVDATDPMAFLNVTVGLELRSEEPVKNFLAKIPTIAAGFGMGAPGAAPKIEKYLERDLYSFDDESGFVVAFVDKTLVIGRQNMVKDLIRRKGKPGQSLVEKPEFQAVAKDMPAEVSAIAYAKPDSTAIDQYNDILRTMLESEQIPVPDLKKIYELFGASGGYGSWTDKGFYSRSWAKFKEPAKKPGK
jgi:hypothetical protein